MEGPTYEAERIPAKLLLVVDRSGSMADNNKWSGATSAISLAIDSNNVQLDMGLLRFPEGKYDQSAETNCLLSALIGTPTPECMALLAEGGCKDINTTPNVPVGPLKDTRAPIESLMGTTFPDGNTPTRWALRNAHDYMKTLDVDSEKYVLLLTDGEPTTASDISGTPLGTECGQLSDITSETWDASHASTPIRTFVIGAPGSEGNLAFLSELAFNGDTGKPGCVSQAGNCHYQLSAAGYQSELKAALSEIFAKATSCVFEMPSGQGSLDPQMVNVHGASGGQDVLVFKDPSHKSGWDYTDQAHARIQLYGSQCDALKQGQLSAISISLGCPSRVQ